MGVQGIVLMTAMVFAIGLAIYEVYTARNNTASCHQSDNKYTYVYTPRVQERTPDTADTGKNKKKRRNSVPECVICCEPLPEGDGGIILPCKHKFHDQCITRWFKENRSCPVCRKCA
ncbi:Protein goliath-like Protein [Tribolium castaneum]|uniref:Protein goliath-like Protein n=1 Tax=Tribolium castaneum TaxID=7070 RepID=A0A139WML7_TRICA|nr:PREDICTED: RING finger protein 165-like [Tribolium castaneum]KYB29091.1 Protein goliath-like Protein [Tribolium castaneum]|eukprot:XP_008201356.1 PREDICTED: RING finger protein 165-like [Tribolium castaneum]